MKTNNPHPAPTNIPSDAKPRRIPIAAYSDEDLQKRLKQTNHLLGGQLYLLIVGMAALLGLFGSSKPDTLMERVGAVLTVLVVIGFTATVYTAGKRKPFGRPMALIAFAIVIISALISLIGGNIPSLIQILIGGICFFQHWQDKAYFEPDLIPTRAQLNHEINRRHREKARTAANAKKPAGGH